MIVLWQPVLLVVRASDQSLLNYTKYFNFTSTFFRSLSLKTICLCNRLILIFHTETMKFHVVLFLLLFLLVAWLFEVNYAHPFSSAGILPIEQKGAHSNHTLKTIRFSEFAHQQKRAAVSLSLRMRSITSQEDLPIARIKEKDAELNFDNGQCLYRVIFCTIKLFLISKIYALRSRK